MAKKKNFDEELQKLMAMMTSLQLYGGPAHGRTVLVWSGLYRFEVDIPRHLTDRDLYSSSSLSQVLPPEYDTTSYYLQTWAEQAITEAGSVVRRTLEMGVWERGELFSREKHELLALLRQQPWVWNEEPNILTHFCRWWEKEIHENGWAEVWVH